MTDVQIESPVDQALQDLTEGEKAWAKTSLADRLRLLADTRQRVIDNAHQWVQAAAFQIKKLDPESPLVGEEWISGPYAVAGAIASLIASLEQLQAGQSPLQDAEFGVTPGGRTTVSVLPLNIFDKLLLSGFSAELWLQPGVDKAEALRTAGLAQRDPSRTQGVGAVLGAGNITSIAPLDTLYELFANNRVVALKLNPITDPLLPVFTQVLQPFIAIGAVRILTGGADVGTYLVHHQLVDHVHMTGSSVTHDAIVFGTGEEGAQRKAANQPVLDKAITSELGGVSPTIVVPGQWSSSDIEFQTRHIATQRLHNNGYNCIASQVVVLSKAWPQRQEFLAALRKAVDEAPSRPAYYPGSDDRVAGAQQSYPDAERLGQNGARVLVVDPEDRTALLRTEYFGPVLGVIELDVANDPDGTLFLQEAARVANDEFVGTLGVNVLAHPDTIKALGSHFDTLVEDLRYGTVAINAWTGVGYLTPSATWGAFPGHVLNDVQSGIGVVHNGFLVEKPERTVVRGPFRPFPRSFAHGEWALSPKPPWFVSNATAAGTGELLVDFAGKPSLLKVPRIFISALRG
ncbi:aldehyde dehydrogenase [Mycobacteroides chelonae]|jgi:acyl-CoA reductase-like NAD-dependent aldehyde dehydrogenase|uniref:aldehyde dehydrogenase family protein n=1 Tax=Mycobacteroides chelonae TaxID=1774 RepID=UPI0007A0F1E5|nr:aldehyde dehydrogenase family protein [Mycobacteroides chelonae]AMW22076.1 aldehyde dehydrogenase family protein [Mycobacterium sp. QIA-37]MBF9523710.1 aldehyde dehydrogenase family protein [Mycobacteroides chelonae]OHU57476.1 aldehyde dehydrogenase [Mycobacteroides chelonae]PKQ57757.1 aldehyde dehydrogenase [Mycobacterium sp. MHSD3]